MPCGNRPARPGTRCRRRSSPAPDCRSIEANDENSTKKSNGISSVSACRFQAPMIFGAMAFHIRSSVRRSIGASSKTIAACMMPRNGPICALNAGDDLSGPGSRSVTSAANVITSTPRRRRRSTAASADAEGALRPTSARCRAPRRARRSANANPKPPRPPVMR